MVKQEDPQDLKPPELKTAKTEGELSASVAQSSAAETHRPKGLGEPFENTSNNG